MVNRDQLEKAKPNVGGATYQYIRGEITKEEYEKLVEEERRRARERPQGQAASAHEPYPSS